MTKKALIEAIEDDGAYRNVKIDKQGKVTGVCFDEPSHYHSDTNTGGRRYMGTDTEVLAALVMAGSVSKEEADSYDA